MINEKSFIIGKRASHSFNCQGIMAWGWLRREWISKYRIPVWELLGTEVNVFPFESVRTVFGTIVDQIIARIQMLVVGKNKGLWAVEPRCFCIHKSLSDQAVGFSQGEVEST